MFDTIKRTLQIYLFFFIAALVGGCNNKKDADVSNIKLNLTIERFDEDLDRLNPQNLSEEAPRLQRQYGSFYADFMEKILNIGSINDTSYYTALRATLNHPDYKALRNEVDRKFENLSRQEEELTDAFKHVLYYFPEQKVPRIISYLSGFAVQVPLGTDYIGIGLDMFLGTDSRFYPALRHSIPGYVSRRFTPENITPRVMEVFLREELFPEPEKSLTLLDKMLYHGKILYLMNRMMPHAQDSVLIGYTAAQYKWCHTYEADIWAYFLEHDLLYEADYMKIQKYLSEAPFTPGIGTENESAPKLAWYIGWQIVKRYMDRADATDLQELLLQSDSQTLLKTSGYRP